MIFGDATDCDSMGAEMKSHRETSGDEQEYEYEWQRPRESQGLLGRISSVDKQLILMLVVGLGFYAFTRSIDRQFDEAIAAEKAEKAEAHRNPWSKDKAKLSDD